MFKKVYLREKYLSKIRPFYNSGIIKVITGIRKGGKFFILKEIINELQISGVKEENIICIPLDKRGFKNISSSKQFEDKIEELIGKDDYE